jgi:hypothetical protein
MGVNRVGVNRTVGWLQALRNVGRRSDKQTVLKPTTDVPRQPRRRLPMSGAYDSGRSDTAARSAEILR